MCKPNLDLQASAIVAQIVAVMKLHELEDVGKVNADVIERSLNDVLAGYGVSIRISYADGEEGKPQLPVIALAMPRTGIHEELSDKIRDELCDSPVVKPHDEHINGGICTFLIRLRGGENETTQANEG